MTPNFSRFIYPGTLILLAVSLPLSPFLLSLAQIILLVNWLLERNFQEKWNRLIHQKSLLVFLTIYMVHLAGMIYSTDLTYGIHDLKIKLPLLILPLVMGTSSNLSSKEFRLVLRCFCGGVILSTFISVGKLWYDWGEAITDIREISAIISHIRLALMVNLSIFILYWDSRKINSTKIAIVLWVGIAWLVTFLFLLKSLTGLIIFSLITTTLLVYHIRKSKDLMTKWFLTVGSLMILLLATGYLSYSVSRFYYIEKTETGKLETKTIRGNPYINDTTSQDFENGHLTWIYVCEKELKPAWNKKSKLDYMGSDLKGQDLRLTLIRYLTAKGLTKDSLGLATLQHEDIRNIEKGIANPLYTQRFSLYPRIYQLLWEINQYKSGGNPSGHSFTQRFEYMHTALSIIRDHPWIGVGTGNVAQAFDEKYKVQHSVLTPRWRLRAHNQMITFLLTFGYTGLALIVFSLIYPVFQEKKFKSYLMVLFLSIAFLSFLNEDTLETQAGVTFFAFFYLLFLFNPQPKNDNKAGFHPIDQGVL